MFRAHERSQVGLFFIAVSYTVTPSLLNANHAYLDLSSDLVLKNQLVHHRSLDKSFAKSLPSIPDLIPTWKQIRTYSHLSSLVSSYESGCLNGIPIQTNLIQRGAA